MSRHFVCDATRMHILALVLGCAILSAFLWDSFETLVLPRTPVRKLRLTRLFYRATWGLWIARARTLRLDRRREGFLGLSNRLMMSVPRFRSTSREPDNWQTEPASDGGSPL